MGIEEIKYKRMWEELYEELNNELYNFDEISIFNIMDRIKQKYFSFKKTITFTIEAPTEHYLGTAINDFEMFWCNYNGVKGHCAKYYYGEK